MTARFRYALMGALVVVLLGFTRPALAGDLVGSVSAPHPEHVVIFVDAVPGAFPAGHATLDQTRKMFSPYVLPVVKGTTVAFHNSDSLAHNVFGVGGDEFNLGTFGKDSTREHTFNKVGDVAILCNVHPEMEAHVLVLQNPYFAQPDASGHFHIAGLPAGTYVVKAWYEGKIKKQSVTVAATGQVTVSF